MGRGWRWSLNWSWFSDTWVVTGVVTYIHMYDLEDRVAGCSLLTLKSTNWLSQLSGNHNVYILWQLLGTPGTRRELPCTTSPHDSVSVVLSVTSTNIWSHVPPNHNTFHLCLLFYRQWTSLMSTSLPVYSVKSEWKTTLHICCSSEDSLGQNTATQGEHPLEHIKSA